MDISRAKLTRRDLLKSAAVGTVAVGGFSRLAPADDADNAEEKLPSVRVITRGPKHHWFAYYDKFEFDPTDRYVLSMEVDFEDRSPKPDDFIKIGMVDLEDNDCWIELDRTSLWCWQQGCMLQWLPGSKSEIIWNDRQGSRYVCHVMDVHTRKKRTIPHPVYTVSPDGKTAFAPDFRRVNDMRSGYGYVGEPDPNADRLAPEKSGIFRIDLETGKSELIVSLADMPKIPYPWNDLSKKKHYFNHLLVNPDGTRLEFLNRWAPRDGNDWRTRMLTVAPDGSDIRVVDNSGGTSHFDWRDPTHILAWSMYSRRNNICPGKLGKRDAFCLFEDKPEGGNVEVIGPDVMTKDGHCTYLPNKDWILNDTYPDKNRFQHPFLYHVPTGRRISLGNFLLPKKYKGELRIDTHPRSSRDGTKVVIDAPDGKAGRQLHLIDISGIVK